MNDPTIYETEWCAIEMLRHTQLLCGTLPEWLHEACSRLQERKQVQTVSVTRFGDDEVSTTEMLAWALVKPSKGSKELLGMSASDYTYIPSNEVQKRAEAAHRAYQAHLPLDPGEDAKEFCAEIFRLKHFNFGDLILTPTDMTGADGMPR